MTPATLNVALVWPGLAPVPAAIPYTSAALHALVGGWFDHIDLPGGLVCGFAETRASVASDLALDDAPWYREASSSSPCVFLRAGAAGGFASLLPADFSALAAICQQESLS